MMLTGSGQSINLMVLVSVCVPAPRVYGTRAPDPRFRVQLKVEDRSFS